MPLGGQSVPIPVQPPEQPVVLLPVPYFEQEQSNWCWAACCQMFLRFRDPQNTERQCDMASRQFNGRCCASPQSAACDLGCWPEDAYDAYSVAYAKQGSAASYRAVKAELAAGRPVQVYYEWGPLGMSSHVAMVSGHYADKSLEVLDPSPTWGRQRRAFAQVRSAYGLGSWEKTYKGLQ